MTLNSGGILNAAHHLAVNDDLTNGGIINETGTGVTIQVGGTTINNGTLTASGSGAELNFTGSFINNGTVSLPDENRLTVQNTLSNNGNLTLSDGAQAFAESGLVNTGTITADGFSTFVDCSLGNVSNSGTFIADGFECEILVYQTLTNLSGTTLTGGTYEVTDSNQIYLPGNIITNAANIILSGPNPTFGAIAPFAINSGSFTLQNGATFTTVGDLSNSGTMLVGPAVGANSASSLTITGNYNQTTGLTQIDGTLTLANGGSLNLSGGILKGTGTIIGPILNTGGTLAPGDSPGQLTLTGNYSQSSSSTLDVLLGGYTPGTNFSLLSITGSATLAGIMEVDLINGFTPKIGDQFTFLTTTQGITGGFDTLASNNGLFTYTVDYDGGNVEITVTSVPDPGGFTAIVISGMLTLRRRRNAK